jgi:hypothetical protein
MIDQIFLKIYKKIKFLLLILIQISKELNFVINYVKIFITYCQILDRFYLLEVVNCF